MWHIHPNVHKAFCCLVYVYHHISSHSIQTLTGAADWRNIFLSWLSVDFLESFSKMLGVKPSPASLLVVAAAELVAGWGVLCGLVVSSWSRSQTLLDQKRDISHVNDSDYTTWTRCLHLHDLAGKTCYSTSDAVSLCVHKYINTSITLSYLSLFRSFLDRIFFFFWCSHDRRSRFTGYYEGNKLNFYLSVSAGHVVMCLPLLQEALL